MPIVPLNQNALTTLRAAQRALGVSDAESNEKIRRLINAVSDFAERFTGKKFWRDTAIVERNAGFGLGKMVLKRAPVNSVATITFDGAPVDLDDLEIEDAEAAIISRLGGFRDTSQVVRDISRGRFPGSERPLWEVTYDGGYYTPKQVDDAAAGTPAVVLTRGLPWDLEEAALETIRANNFTRSRDPTVVSEKLMSWSANYGKGGATKNMGGLNVPSGALGVFEIYRKLI